MANRDTNARVEVAGLTLRGTVTGWNLGGVKRTPTVNGDATVDFTEEYVPGSIDIDVSMVTGTELKAIEAIVEEQMLVTFSNKRKVAFPAMTFLEKGDVNKEGTATVKFSGPKGGYV